jgi:hypothetical protein
LHTSTEQELVGIGWFSLSLKVKVNEESFPFGILVNVLPSGAAGNTAVANSTSSMDVVADPLLLLSDCRVDGVNVVADSSFRVFDVYDVFASVSVYSSATDPSSNTGGSFDTRGNSLPVGFNLSSSFRPRVC